MEGYRTSKSRRRAVHAASRRAGSVANVSPRKGATKRKKTLGSTSRKRRTLVNYYVDPSPFSPPRRPSPRGVRRERSPSPYDVPRSRRVRDGGSPDPDEDPDVDPQAGGFVPPVRYNRRERMNLDVEYTGSLSGGGALWTVPIPSVVVVAQGTGYAQRATNFIRVSRLAFKITAVRSTTGSENTFAVAPFPDPISRYNAMYFRFAVIYDKQCDTANPTVTYPDVFATGPALAINEFRLPATTQRFEVLHDCTYRWQNGELSMGSVEVVPPVQEPFWMQTGLVAKEEIFVDCEKLVRFFTSTGTVSDIVSGNIFYMVCSLGGDVALTITSRTTFSDNL